MTTTPDPDSGDFLDPIDDWDTRDLVQWLVARLQRQFAGEDRGIAKARTVRDLRGILGEQRRHLLVVETLILRQMDILERHRSATTALQRDVTELKGDVAELKRDVVELKGNVVELKGDVAELKGDVVELTRDVAELKRDVAELKQRVGRLERDVAELKGDVAALKSEVAALRNDLTQLKVEVADIKGAQRNQMAWIVAVFGAILVSVFFDLFRWLSGA